MYGRPRNVLHHRALPEKPPASTSDGVEVNAISPPNETKSKPHVAARKTSSLTTVDGVQLQYELRGSGPFLIVCAGGPYNNYSYLISGLRKLELRYTVVYWSYRGSGKSDNAPKSTYNFSQMASDLEELRLHLGARAISLLCHCMGGFVGEAYAATYEACTRIVFLSYTPSLNPLRMSLRLVVALGARRAPLLVLKGVTFFLNPRLRRGRRLRYLKARQNLVSLLWPIRPGFEDEVARQGYFAANANGDALVEHMKRKARLFRLRAIACPSLVIYGARDAMALAGADILSKNLRDCVVHEIDEVGHYPFIEAAETNLELISKFLMAYRESDDVGRISGGTGHVY